MRIALPALLVAALATAATSVSAQVLVLDTDFGGELNDDDETEFRQALEAGLERGAPGAVVGAAETNEQIGPDLAACDGGDCALAIGFAVSASVAVRAEVYAEAEIYDFTVRAYDLTTGETLVTQTGDCTFCPVAEAIEAFGFTAEAAVSAVDPMPAPSPGPAPAVEEPVVGTDTEPVGDGPAYVEGPIQFNISVVPDTATILINGTSVGEGRARLEVGAQELAVSISAEGFEDYTEDVTLRDSMGGPIFLRIALTPEQQVVYVETEVEAPGRAPRPAGAGPDFNTRAVGGILLGSGAVMTVGGIVLLALDGSKTCADGPTELCQDVWEFTAGGATLTTLGGLSMGTGIGLLISGMGSDSTEQAATTRISFAPARRGGAVFLQRQF